MHLNSFKASFYISLIKIDHIRKPIYQKMKDISICYKLIEEFLLTPAFFELAQLSSAPACLII